MIQEDSIKISICFNIDKKAKYLKDKVSTFFYIYRLLFNNNKTLIKEYNTVKTLWAYLKLKYTRINIVITNFYIIIIQIFIFQFIIQLEITIIKTQNKFKEY